jgi:hypothetical protein
MRRGQQGRAIGRPWPTPPRRASKTRPTIPSAGGFRLLGGHPPAPGRSQRWPALRRVLGPGGWRRSASDLSVGANGKDDLDPPPPIWQSGSDEWTSKISRSAAQDHPDRTPDGVGRKWRPSPRSEAAHAPESSRICPRRSDQRGGRSPQRSGSDKRTCNGAQPCDTRQNPGGSWRGICLVRQGGVGLLALRRTEPTLTHL